METFKSFIVASKDYSSRITSDSQSALQTSIKAILQLQDISLYNPSSPVIDEYFRSLRSVFSTAGAGLPIISGLLALVDHASPNEKARLSFQTVYHFVPEISRLFCRLTPNPAVALKFVHTLNLLTYDMQIKWLEAYLMELMRTLVNILKGKEVSNDLLVESLSVMSNLCRENKFAIISMSKFVGFKELIRILLSKKLDSSYERAVICEITILLHLACGDSKLNNVQVVTYVDRLFECFTSEQKFTTDRFIDFMKWIVKVPTTRSALERYAGFGAQMSELLKFLDSVELAANLADSNGEVACQILSFVNLLLQVRNEALLPLYPSVVTSCMRLMQYKDVAPIASAVIVELVTQCNTMPEEKEPSKTVKKHLMSSLEYLINIICQRSDDKHIKWDCTQQICGVLQILQELCKKPDSCNAVRKGLDPSTLTCLVKHVLEKVKEDIDALNQPFDPTRILPLHYSKDGDSVHLTSLVVECVSLLGLLSANSGPWLSCLTDVLSSKIVINLLANAMFIPNSSLQKKVLTLIGNAGFTHERIDEFGSILSILCCDGSEIGHPSRSDSHDSHRFSLDELNYVRQRTDVDELLVQVQEYMKNKQSIPLSRIMELYEVKNRSFEYFEKMLENGSRAAEKDNVDLKYQLRTVKAQNVMYHDILHGAQVEIEQLSQHANTLQNELELVQSTHLQKEEHLAKELSDRIQKMGVLSAQISTQNQRLLDTKAEIDGLKKQMKDVEANKIGLHSRLKETNAQLTVKSTRIDDLEDQLKQKKADCADLNHEMQKLNNNITALKTSMSQQDENIKSLQQDLKGKDDKYEKVIGELQKLEKIQELIRNVK